MLSFDFKERLMYQFMGSSDNVDAQVFSELPDIHSISLPEPEEDEFFLRFLTGDLHTFLNGRFAFL